MSEFRKGQGVTYDDGFKKEVGIVKSQCEDPDYYFVVCHCGGNWKEYEKYTAERTHKNDLKPGWMTKPT